MNSEHRSSTSVDLSGFDEEMRTRLHDLRRLYLDCGIASTDEDTAIGGFIEWVCMNDDHDEEPPE